MSETFNPFQVIGPLKSKEDYYGEWSEELRQREEKLVAKEKEAEVTKRENAQWLEFAEAACSHALPKAFKESESWDLAMENAAMICADFADAMLEECKRRNRL